MGARPSPQSPASIRTTTSSVLFPPWIVIRSEHVVEMAVRQQQAMQPAESGAAPKQLALSALTAIDHDAMAAGLH